MKNVRAKSKVKSKKSKLLFTIHCSLFTLCLLFTVHCSLITAQAQSTEFTYQGRLLDSSLPPTANYDFQFSLWNALVADTQQGSTQTVTGVAVANGIFTVKLDFGAQFTGAARFIQIEVRPTGPGAYTLLAPRQAITSAPYAVRSANATTADTATDATQLGGVPASGYIQTLGGTITGNLTVNGTITGNGSGVTSINGGNITSGSVTSSQLSPEAVPNTTAYKLLGSLRWDLLKGQANFAVGSNPYGVAFDGANIWVANLLSNNVTKLRASDGACNGVVGPPTAACTFPVGNNPRGVAFDGANIWVANEASGNVTKLRASDGTTLGTFAVGGGPLAVAFDGANIWVVLNGSDSITKLRASDGACVGTCTFTVYDNPRGVAFDGANIWVTGTNTVLGVGLVTKLRASDGAQIGNSGAGTSPYAVAFDGANIWVANRGSDNVTKVRASDGVNLGTFPAGTNPIGVAFDGANIWVANQGSSDVTKLRASDGANLGTFPVGTIPIAVAFDGANIWVANASSNTVTRLPPAFPQ